MKVISELQFEQYRTQQCNLAQVSFPNSNQPVMYFLISDDEIKGSDEKEIKQVINNNIISYLKNNFISFEKIQIEVRYNNNIR